MSLARFQLPYATTAQRTAVTPNDKDLIYDTDLKKVFVGDGTTVGGVTLGVKGDTGAGIVWHTAYDAGHDYVVADAVPYLGSAYICILNSTGNLPTDGTYWELLAQKGTDATHTQGTDTTLGAMAANVNMNSHKLTSLSVPTSNGDSVRATTKITEALLESATDLKHAATTVSAPISLSGQALSLKNDATGTITEIDTAARVDTSNTKIPTSQQVVTEISESFKELFNSTLNNNQDWVGFAETGTAGATLDFGDLCHLAVADSRWEFTDADAEATAGPVRLGLCVLAAAADGAATRMLLIGKIREDNKFPTLTVDAPVFISTSPGLVQVAAPSGSTDIIRVIGHGIQGHALFFNPSSDWMEVT